MMLFIRHLSNREQCGQDTPFCVGAVPSRNLAMLCEHNNNNIFFYQVRLANAMPLIALIPLACFVVVLALIPLACFVVVCHLTTRASLALGPAAIHLKRLKNT
jgi:hypothetical protein